MFMEREVVRDKVGGIYIMTYIYIYIVIWFWIKHISRPYLDYETTRENEKKKSKNFEFGERPDFDVLKIHIIFFYPILMSKMWCVSF